MSCTKIRASLSQHWRHSARGDCLGSCWRAISLNEDCKHAAGVWEGGCGWGGGGGKGSDTALRSLGAKSTQASSTDSWFQPQVRPDLPSSVACSLRSQSHAANHSVLWQQHVTQTLRQEMCWRGFFFFLLGETCGGVTVVTRWRELALHSRVTEL